MSTVQILSIVLLIVVLAIAIWRRLNIGLLALAAALPILILSNASAAAMYDAFPGNLLVLIAGVSLLFAHLEMSGTLRWCVQKIYGVIGDRQMLLPWVGFIIGAGLSSAGAFSTGVIAFFVPMLAHFGVKFRKSFILSELAVVIGANCAGLSPLNPTGALVRTAASKDGVQYPEWALWALSVAVAAIAVLCLQLGSLIVRRRGTSTEVYPAPADTADTPTKSRPAYMWASGGALIAFLILVIFAGTDVGLTAIFLAAVLQIAFRPPERTMLARIPWNSIILLCGLLTYLGLMEKVGTMTSMAHILSYFGVGAALILVIAYLTTILCNIESSTLGVLGLMMPIVFSTFGQSHITFWVLVASCIPAALMVVNPIHVAGTLIIGNSAPQFQDVLFRRFLALAGIMTLIVPGILALIPIVIN